MYMKQAWEVVNFCYCTLNVLLGKALCNCVRTQTCWSVHFGGGDLKKCSTLYTRENVDIFGL